MQHSRHISSGRAWIINKLISGSEVQQQLVDLLP
jgi:hypothetical protein